MKKIKALISLLIILSMAVGCGLLSRSSQNVFLTTASSVIDEASKSLEEWIQNGRSSYYENISVKPVLVESNVKPDFISEAIFNVEVRETLKARTENDFPTIRGMLKCLNLEKPNLKKSQIDFANRQLEELINELMGYIGKTQEMNVTVKATFKSDSNYKIKPDSMKFYVLDPMGETFQDAENILKPATEVTEENLGFEHMKDIIEEAAMPNSSIINDSNNLSVSTNSTIVDNYNGIAAGDYAIKWALSYNTTDYPWNVQYGCADFVSQAMHNGNMPMDNIEDASHWWYDKNKYPLDYSPWVYVPSLVDYMNNSGRLEASDWYWVNKGNMIVFVDSSGNRYHVALVTYNDTHTRLLCQHDDPMRQNYPYDSSGKLFYKIHYYVFVP